MAEILTPEVRRANQTPVHQRTIDQHAALARLILQVNQEGVANFEHKQRRSLIAFFSQLAHIEAMNADDSYVIMFDDLNITLSHAILVMRSADAQAPRGIDKMNVATIQQIQTTIINFCEKDDVRLPEIIFALVSLLLAYTKTADQLIRNDTKEDQQMMAQLVEETDKYNAEQIRKDKESAARYVN